MAEILSLAPALPARATPANIDAEQMLLGAILTNNEILNQVGDFLIANHFYEPIHQKLYQAILNIVEKGLSASVITVHSSLAQDAQFKQLGGKEYLARIAAMAVTVINSYEHARIIYDLALKRQLITIGEEMVNNTYDAGLECRAGELIESAESNLFTLSTEGNIDRSFERVSASIAQSLATINRVMKTPEHTTGVTTGYTDLDHKLFGFHNSDLVILAGRPSMGKTALALNLAINACQSLYTRHQNDPNPPSVGFFSLEMSSEQLATRLLSMYSNVDSTSIRSGKLKEAEYNALRQKAEEMSRLPFFIDDSGALTISAIRTRARRLKRKNNLAVLFIDYLQLVTGNQRKDNRVLEISEITQGLKSLAKELNIPIIVLSQLSRAVESRDDKRPMLSDLRESGAIEQDADVVMFIYRDEYYLARKEPTAGTDKHAEWLEKLNQVHNQAEVIVAKHRNGPIGNVTLYYDSNHSKFGNLDKRYSAQN